GEVEKGGNDRVRRAERFAGESEGIPNRVGGDRSAAARICGDQGGSGSGAAGSRGRETAGGLLHGKGQSRKRGGRGGGDRTGRSAWLFIREVAGVHDASCLCAVGKAADDGERKAGPEGLADAGRRRIRHGRV